MNNTTKWAIEDKIKDYLINSVKLNIPKEKIKIIKIDMMNSDVAKIINELCNLDYIEPIEGISSEKIITESYYKYVKYKYC